MNTSLFRDPLTLATAIVVLIAFLIPLFVGSNLYYLTVLVLMLIFIIYASAWNFLTFPARALLGMRHSSGSVLMEHLSWLPDWDSRLS